MELIDKEMYEKYPCLYRAEDGACAACAYMCDCGWPEDCKVRKETVERQPTLTPPNEWVSVNERLPETAGEYLVVYHPCYWDDVSAEICVGIDSFRGKTAWAKKKYQRVTHWMPLPAPPTKDENNT